MRIIILLIISATLFAWDLVGLAPVCSFHDGNKDEDGKRYNSFNPGAGIRYITEGSSYFSATAIVLKDSYSNAMYLATVGSGFRPFEHLEIGAEMGISYKNLRMMTRHADTCAWTGEMDGYRVLPAAAITASAVFDPFVITAAYTPTIKHGDYTFVGVTLLMFGYKF